MRGYPHGRQGRRAAEVPPPGDGDRSHRPGRRVDLRSAASRPWPTRSASSEWWLSALHVTQAQRTSQGSGVTVALLDTGVDPAQPDLAGSVITGPDYTELGREAGQPVLRGARDRHGEPDRRPRARPGRRRRHPRAWPRRPGCCRSGSALDSGDPLLDRLGHHRPACPPRSRPGSGTRSAAAPRSSTCRWTRASPRTPWWPPGADPGAEPGPAADPGRRRPQQAAAGGSAAEQSAVAYALSQGVVLVAPGGDNGDQDRRAELPGRLPRRDLRGRVRQQRSSRPRSPATSRT